MGYGSKPPTGLTESGLKKWARNKLNNAVNAGWIVRPDRCEQCGQGWKTACGAAGIQGAHGDYTKPYDVIWLCIPCHRKYDKLNIGEKNGRSTLTDEQVREIRQIFATGKVDKSTLAYRYNTTSTTIRNIVTFRTRVSAGC